MPKAKSKAAPAPVEFVLVKTPNLRAAHTQATFEAVAAILPATQAQIMDVLSSGKVAGHRPAQQKAKEHKDFFSYMVRSKWLAPAS